MTQTEAIDLLLRIYFWVVSVIILLKSLDMILNSDRYEKIRQIQIENGTYDNKIGLVAIIGWVLYIFSIYFL